MIIFSRWIQSLLSSKLNKALMIFVISSQWIASHHLRISCSSFSLNKITISTHQLKNLKSLKVQEAHKSLWASQSTRIWAILNWLIKLKRERLNQIKKSQSLLIESKSFTEIWISMRASSLMRARRKMTQDKSLLKFSKLRHRLNKTRRPLLTQWLSLEAILRLSRLKEMPLTQCPAHLKTTL